MMAAIRANCTEDKVTLTKSPWEWGVDLARREGLAVVVVWYVTVNWINPMFVGQREHLSTLDVAVKQISESSAKQATECEKMKGFHKDVQDVHTKQLDAILANQILMKGMAKKMGADTDGS